MRVTIEVPDRVARDAVREYRTVRQQAEYIIARAVSEQARPDQAKSDRKPEPAR